MFVYFEEGGICLDVFVVSVGVGIGGIDIVGYVWFSGGWKFGDYFYVSVYEGIDFGIALVFIYTSSPKLQEDYGDIIDFGFEAFIHLVENGELSTASSDGLTEYHLSIWPQNQKTYYIGDMRWTKGDSYYGDSDVGYVRLLLN